MLVQSDLRSFRLSMDDNCSHLGRTLIAFSEKFLELADVADVIRIPQRPQCRAKLEVLSRRKRCGGRLFEIAHFPQKDCMPV